MKLAQQYDRTGFFRALIRQRWNAIIDPKKFRSDHDRLARINGLASKLEDASDSQLQVQVAAWKRGFESGKIESTDEIIEPAFALLREASRRTTGLFHYDEQILAGLALVRGGIAEMATGEGKTLAVSLPAFVFALHGKGVHVVTVNSYLAERDYEFSKPIFDFLGLTIAHLPEGGGDNAAKRDAYAQDITYGVGYEFGFDYMRDQLAKMRHPNSGPGEELRLAILGIEKPGPDVCQRGLAFTIIDEVDSVLIDEAGSPLLISEPDPNAQDDSAAHRLARDQAAKLVEDEHFLLDKNKRSIEFTELGRREIFHRAKKVPWDNLRRPWESYVLAAMKAAHLFERDVHYIVEDDAVVIVDEFTGRKFEDRSWREGQHQAVEAKENVTIKPENDSAASITRQRFYAQYSTICGLTGTAAESAGELWRFFKMPVTSIPLHRPSARTIFPERIFQTAEAMRIAIAEDIQKRRETGQPVLVGTRTIRDSEALAEVLRARNVDHVMLTAKQDAEEEAIVSRAGESGSVVIATNMAGRGTHIDLDETSKTAGGLHVICVERNESPRIDRQLVGRGARNGQPGSAQSFVSAEDYLLETFAAEAGERLKNQCADENAELPKTASRIFDTVQAQVERVRYEQRTRMAEHDEWSEETKQALAS